MNTNKFKSVAVAIETYKLLKKLAALDDRSAGMQITYLVKQESKRRKYLRRKDLKPLRRLDVALQVDTCRSAPLLFGEQVQVA